MKKRLLKLSIVLLIPITIFAVLMTVGSMAGTAVSGNVDTGQSVQHSTDEPSIVAARLISIPYTVDSVLPLLADGQTVQASGPGTCADLGDSFTIRLTITKNGQQNRAMGVTQGDCAIQDGWAVTATTPGNRTLVPGPAEVCGKAMIREVGAPTLVGDWCVNVTLQ